VVIEQTLITVAVALVVCVLCQWAAWRVKLPAILFLLGAGILSGPVFHLFDPEQLMGHLFFPFVQLSVAIILFEGSLSLKFREILGQERVVRNMLTFGLVITWLVSAVSARFLIGVSWEIAFLFGALTVVTGPTVIAPMIRAVRPTQAIANILRWEGIVIDPIGVGLAVLVYEFIIAESVQQAWGMTFLTFAEIVLIGGSIGAAAAYLFGLVLRNRLVPEFLQNVATLGVIFASFVLANTLQHESGLVTVTVLGMWLGNMRGVELDEILHFKESLSILLISLLFLMLTARLDVSALVDLGWGALGVFLVIQFVGRPLNVLASTYRAKLTSAEKAFLAWIAPRGIVAAAISSLFAIRLEEVGFGDARLLVPLTFTIIIGTVVLQSLTAVPLANRLKVAEPEPRGFLIIGANIVARAIGKVLQENGVRVLLVDTGWERIQEAVGEGLEVYHGSPLSEHADRHMTLTGIGRMLGLAPYESINMAAALHYRMEFGRNNVFVLRSGSEKYLGTKKKAPVKRAARLILDGTLSYGDLIALLKKGGEIKTVSYADEQSYEKLLQRHGAREVLILFFIDDSGRIYLNNERESLVPEEGWSLIALLPSGEVVND
jgi:NhaP-type Na+/H+ or K+/H+ antiporter